MQQNWQRQYISALLTSKAARAAQYESPDFVRSVINEPPDGIQELLLHRTIAQLRTTQEALDLLDIVRMSDWDSYAPRILARIADTEVVLAERPELTEYFSALSSSKGYAPYSIKDWYLLTDGSGMEPTGAPHWAGNATSVNQLFPDVTLARLTIDEVVTILQFFFETNVRLFQIALLTFSDEDKSWALVFHRLVSVPFIALYSAAPKKPSSLMERVPSPVWAPQWRLTLRRAHWQIYENHTNIELNGLGTTGIYPKISILLALSGLLRDGIALSPLDPYLVRPLSPSHPIWGLRDREFSAAGTGHQATDIRALALGFLEALPATYRVSMFRSRLAIYFVPQEWSRRKSASMTTAETGFYHSVLKVASLYGANLFRDVVQYVNDSPFQTEPALQFFKIEAISALQMFDALAEAGGVEPYTVRSPNSVLCVTHSSVPEQTGGYALRAHGILTSLKEQGVDISAVTRPGFPYEGVTAAETTVVDGVEYSRLAYTGVHRQQGEAQYMMSFIRPFKALFKERGIGVVHLRSTYLVALPALIAARELGLRVIYEVSGLWELVFKDREKESHILKRSRFAELAETRTMHGADQLVVMNDRVREIAIGRGIEANQVLIASNAVDVNYFTPLPPPNNAVFTVGYLGSFQDYEGLDDLVEAVKILKEKEIHVKVLLVGDGPRYRSLRLRLDNEGLSDIVHLVGRVPHSAVKDYYRQMDIVVYPRRSTGATETITPLKPFEALALAKPIIVSSVYPLKEIVGGDERGIVFEQGNAEDLAHSILRLRANSQLREVLGEAGREWVAVNRNWDKVVETFSIAYSRS